jgi:hypothetical protein
MLEFTAFDWCYRFKAGYESLENKECSGQPARKKDKVPRVQKIVHCIIWH